MSIVPEIDFTPLAQLGSVYQKARQDATLSQLGQGLADGTVDYQKAAGMAAQAGRLDVAMSLLDLHNSKQAGLALLGAMPGQHSPAQSSATPAPPPVSAPAPQSRAPMALDASGQPILASDGGLVPPPDNTPRPGGPIPSSSRVWGDEEAIKAGLYDAPAAARTQVAQAAPVTMTDAAGPRPAAAPQLGNNMPGSGLTLIDSPALQGMPDSVRRAIPAMLSSKQYQPQAMALIQKYINPEQWQLFRDTMGNVFTRNSATGESKPLIQATPQMMNANASGLRSPLAYEAATQATGAAAKNTELTSEQKNVSPIPGRGPMNAAAAGAEAKGVGDLLAEQAKTIATKGYAATKTLTTLQRMSQLSDNAYEGAAAPAVQQARSFLTTFGIPSDTVTKGQEFTALSNKLVMDALNGSLGVGVSNADVQFISNINPNLSHTVPARREIITTLTSLAKRDLEIAKMAGEYRRTNGTLDGFDVVAADYAAKNPLFAGRVSVTAGQGAQQGAGSIQEGSTATNKATGQKIIMKGGQWTPVPTGPAT